MAYRTDREVVTEDRRQVETLVLSEPDTDLAFDQPWELRAFALAVAAHRSGLYDWPDFQRLLIASINRDESQPYYRHWLTALESLLADRGALSPAVIDERAEAILATPKDADHHVPRPEPVAIDPAH